MQMFEKRKKLHENEKKFLTEQAESATEASESAMEQYTNSQEGHADKMMEMMKMYHNLKNDHSKYKKGLRNCWKKSKKSQRKTSPILNYTKILKKVTMKKCLH